MSVRIQGKNMDNDDLIEMLKVPASQFEFSENPLGFSFPCNICKHASLPEGNDTCANCDHAAS
jgi:hypothetical protein